MKIFRKFRNLSVDNSSEFRNISGCSYAQRTGSTINQRKGVMKKLLFVLLAILPLCSFGIEPVIFKLKGAPITYTVPSEKILLIEHVIASEEDGYDINLTWDFITTNGTYSIDIDRNHNETHVQGILSFNKPLKIPGGTKIQANITTHEDPNGYIVFGLLADQADLYASIETQSDGMLCRNGTFSYDVLAASARPGKIKLQGSTDLEEWHPIVDATIAKINPSSHSVSVPIAGNEKYYVKTLLTSVTQ